MYICIIHISTLSPWLVFHPLVFEAKALPKLSQPIHSALPHSCQVIAANCESTRMSVIDINGVARLDISTSGCGSCPVVRKMGGYPWISQLLPDGILQLV